MKSSRFAHLGELLFGPAWVGALAEALKVAERTTRRWKSGHSSIPEGIDADIAKLCRKRAAELSKAADTLEKDEEAEFYSRTGDGPVTFTRPEKPSGTDRKPSPQK